MSQPAGGSPDPEQFQDPLENYEPRTYADKLEQALAEQTAAEIHSTPFVSLPPQTPVREAIQRLAELHVASLLIAEQGKLVGVFSDRDVLDKVALEYDDVIDRPVSEVMAREPVFVYDTDFAGAVLSVMAVSGYRHVPVLTLDKKIVGIASPQRVSEFLEQYLGKS